MRSFLRPSHILTVAAVVLLTACQSTESEQGSTGPLRLVNRNSVLTAPAGWQEVEPSQLASMNAPGRRLGSVAAKVRSRSDFRLFDEHILMDGDQWLLVVAGRHSHPQWRRVEWVNFVSGSDSHTQLEEAGRYDAAVSRPPVVEGMVGEFWVIEGPGDELVMLAGFAPEEEEGRLRRNLEATARSVRITSTSAIRREDIGSGSDRFLQ